MLAAQEKINASGYTVMAAYFSPCSDGYCRRKLNDKRVSVVHRAALIELLIADMEQRTGTQSCFMIDLFEAYWNVTTCNPMRVYEELCERAKQHALLCDATVFWLQGIDGANWYPDYNQIVVANRTGYSNRVDQLARTIEKASAQYGGVKLFTEVESSDISSTAIRAACEHDAANGEFTKLDEFYANYPQTKRYLIESHAFSPVTDVPEDVDPLPENMDDRDRSSATKWPVEVWNRVISSRCHSELLASRCERIGYNRGWRSALFRVDGLKWSVGAPLESFVAKISSLDRDVPFHTLEERFYRTVAPSIRSVYIPKFYTSFTKLSPFTGVILLEDLHDAVWCNFEEGIPFELAAVAVQQMAQFHAEMWHHPALERSGSIGSWVPDIVDHPKRFVKHFAFFWYRARRSAKDLFSSEWYEFCENYKQTIPELLQQLSRAHHRVLVHGDVFVNNVCWLPRAPPRYGVRGGNARTNFCMLDWQTIKIGNGLVDLSSLIDSGLLGARETELCALYFHTLRRCGVQDYSLNKFQDEYKAARRWSFMMHVPIVGSRLIYDPSFYSKEMIESLCKR